MVCLLSSRPPLRAAHFYFSVFVDDRLTTAGIEPALQTHVFLIAIVCALPLGYVVVNDRVTTEGIEPTSLNA